MKKIIEAMGMEEINRQQHLKQYSSIKLTVYGQMVKLTAGGSGTASEGSNCAGGGSSCKKP